MTSEKDNPNLIGYFWTDMPMWNLKKSKDKYGFNRKAQENYENQIIGGKQPQVFKVLLS